MAKVPYKLSCELFGHDGDVRGLAVFQNGDFVSTSRDKTARVWKRNEFGGNYSQSAVLRGHTNFVSSVCVLNPSKQHPKGYVITGSNDKTICIYHPHELQPVHTVKAHQDTVCGLSAGKEEGTFYSSSWDCTGKLWHLSDLDKPQLTLVGHSAAVWCIDNFKNGKAVTGAADKLVIVWQKDGTVLQKLTGHTDVVRGIVIVGEEDFLTCANDATIRHWNATNGECYRCYYGHGNYIYSIAIIQNSSHFFATGGEDRTVRIWNQEEVEQTISMPAQSIWAVAVLPNTDVICGASDGVVRIFTNNTDRYADEQKLEVFDAAVNIINRNAQMELGGIKVNDLPDETALYKPGKQDGEKRMVKTGDKVQAYCWSQSLQKWELIGDVMGGSGGSTATSGKQLYNGKEYDFVFSVDIEDGAPPLKLPYNSGQDAWIVAQKFIEDNNLSQLYLEQVANFIVKNSQSAPVMPTGVQYGDPFTGGNRYVPSSSNSALPSKSSNGSASTLYIPMSNFLKLETANITAILEKLKELNSKLEDHSLRIPEDKIQAVIQLASEEPVKALKNGGITILKSLLDWPDDVVFPVLDIARLAVLTKEANDELCTDDFILKLVKKYINNTAKPSNQMLTFRFLANMFHHDNGLSHGLHFRDKTLSALQSLTSFSSKNNQIAVSTYILNLTVAVCKTDDMEAKKQILKVLFGILSRMTESEALFRCLVSLGTILSSTENADQRTELVNVVRESEIAVSLLRTTSEALPQNKLVDCSKQIIDLIL